MKLPCPKRSCVKANLVFGMPKSKLYWLFSRRNKTLRGLWFLFFLVNFSCNFKGDCYEYGAYYKLELPSEIKELSMVRVILEKPLPFEGDGMGTDSVYGLQVVNMPKLNSEFNLDGIKYIKSYPYPYGIRSEIKLPVFVDRRILQFQVIYNKLIVDTLTIEYSLEQERRNTKCIEGEFLVSKVLPIRLFENNHTLKAKLP